MQIPPEVTEQIMKLVGSLLALLLSWLVLTVRSKMNAGYTRDLMLRLADAVETAVRAVGQEFSNEVREAAADGKITAEEAAQLRAKALEYVRLYMGESGMKKLEKIVGLNELGELIYKMIEAQLHKLKNGT